MITYNIKFTDGTTESVSADRYIGDHGYFKFFRGGHLPVLSVKVSDVATILESPTSCSTCKHLGDSGSCMRLNSYDQGCGSDIRITPPEGFWCSEYVVKEQVE